MAKVNIEFDTDTKQLSVLVDGVSHDVESVNIVSYSLDGDKKDGYIDMYMKTNKENGIKYRMSAHGSSFEKSNILEDWARQTLNKN